MTRHQLMQDFAADDCLMVPAERTIIFKYYL